ncbi:HEAT repeat domain-containing protein [Candidatus Uabimicrobium amorphum]|uniref:Uncharacterized protein n=1 Tax=Uabimicrobium amorphum TaxID=2596890 RepID=A0A5S9IQD0_UABAM|nr:HEAT repeat domain-containing protein [Candidatus Uabimicrobium amorphum]BBM85964.1 hypothetical protein UABAM_04350 [Candidatus Uabimicrobium amorphum]
MSIKYIIAIIILFVAYYKNWRHVFAFGVSLGLLMSLPVIKEFIIPTRGVLGAVYAAMLMANFAHIILVASMHYENHRLSGLFAKLTWGAIKGAVVVTIFFTLVTFVLSGLVYIFWPHSWRKIAENCTLVLLMGVNLCTISFSFSVFLSVVYVAVEMTFDSKSGNRYKPHSAMTNENVYSKKTTRNEKRYDYHNYEIPNAQKRSFSGLYQKKTEKSDALADHRVYEGLTKEKFIPDSFNTIPFAAFKKIAYFVFGVVALFSILFRGGKLDLFDSSKKRGNTQYVESLQEDYERLVVKESSDLQRNLRNACKVLWSENASSRALQNALSALQENRCRAGVSAALASYYLQRRHEQKYLILSTISILLGENVTRKHSSGVELLTKEWLQNKKAVKYENMTFDRICLTTHVFAEVNNIRASFYDHKAYSCLFLLPVTQQPIAQQPVAQQPIVVNKRSGKRRASRPRRPYRRQTHKKIDRAILPFLWKTLNSPRLFPVALLCLIEYSKKPQVDLLAIAHNENSTEMQRVVASILHWKHSQKIDSQMLIDILNNTNNSHLQHVILMCLGASSDSLSIDVVSKYITHTNDSVRRGAAYASLQHKSPENLHLYLQTTAYQKQDFIYAEALHKIDRKRAEKLLINKLKEAIADQKQSEMRYLYIALQKWVGKKKLNSIERRRARRLSVEKSARELIRAWEKENAE